MRNYELLWDYFICVQILLTTQHGNESTITRIDLEGSFQSPVMLPRSATNIHFLSMTHMPLSLHSVTRTPNFPATACCFFPHWIPIASHPTADNSFGFIDILATKKPLFLYRMDLIALDICS